MGHSRLELHTVLLGITEHVYFQPPSNLQMHYPCIVYARDEEDTKYAGNRRYQNTKRYLVTIIDQDPDSELPDAVGELPLCSFDRHFTADNLNHDVYNLYF